MYGEHEQEPALICLAENAIYEIFDPNAEDEDVFNTACQCFGRKYDLIACLFFLRNNKKYLPIRSTLFDRAFAILNIDYKTARRCSWENYVGYNDILREIQEVMSVVLSTASNESISLWGTLRKEGAPRRLLYLN